MDGWPILSLIVFSPLLGVLALLGVTASLLQSRPA
jgi:hypothetical protein